LKDNSQRICWHICKTAQARAKAKFCKRATKPTHQDRHEMTTNKHDRKEGQQLTAVLRNGGFSGKLKCSFSNQHLWWVDSEVLRNPPLRKAAKR